MKPLASTRQDTPRRIPREAAKSPSPHGPQPRRQPPQRDEVAADPTCRYNRRTRRGPPREPQPRRRTNASEGRNTDKAPVLSPLEARNFDIEVDILAKAMANGARVAEVPIQYRQRIGKKKLKPWHGISIASQMISLAYRLNPTLLLTLAGALLTAPGAALAG